MKCVFCASGVENIDHILLPTFKKYLVQSLKYMQYSLKAFRNWEKFNWWMASHFRGKSSLSIVVRITMTATLYDLCHEGNDRLFLRRNMYSWCIVSKIMFWVTSRVYVILPLIVFWLFLGFLVVSF
jgi:hypothetical protein